jgi:hypothetical protein
MKRTAGCSRRRRSGISNKEKELLLNGFVQQKLLLLGVKENFHDILKLNPLLQQSNPLIQKRRNNTKDYTRHYHQIHLKELWVRNDMVGEGISGCK